MNKFFSTRPFGGAAPAAVVWDFHEVGGDVIGTLSGSLSSGIDVFIGTRIRGTRASISPANGRIFAFDETAGQVLASQVSLTDPEGVTSFGPGIGGDLGTYTGTPFALDAPKDYFIVPGMLSFSGVYTIENETFASIGITPGTYVIADGPNSITLQFTPAAATVPLPASVWLLVAALGGIGVMRVRARRGA